MKFITECVIHIVTVKLTLFYYNSLVKGKVVNHVIIHREIASLSIVFFVYSFII